MKTWKIKLHLISQEFFQYSLITYLILILAETFKEGFVSAFFNLNILLGIVLVSGAVMAVTNSGEVVVSPPKKLTSGDVQNCIVLAATGAVLVYFKTQGLGTIAIIIAILTGAIIVLLSVLVLAEEA